LGADGFYTQDTTRPQTFSSKIYKLARGDTFRVTLVSDAVSSTSPFYVYDFMCYKIPIKYNVITNPVYVVDGTDDYSTDERLVMVYDISSGQYRQKKWIDGKLVYRKTITFNVTAASGVALNQKAIMTGVDKLVDNKIFWYPNGANLDGVTDWYFDNNGIKLTFNLYVNPNGNVGCETISSYSRTDCPVYITIDYTKK
jgi:hypothetical protein